MEQKETIIELLKSRSMKQRELAESIYGEENHTLVEVNQTAEIEQLNISRLHWMKWDIAIKILGIILSLTIFPAAEIVSVLITLCALVIPNQFRL